MLSVCIPIYNHDVRSLVQGLAKQIDEDKLPAEIILIDDASNEKFKTINQSICEKHNYTQLPQNIGRAKIRNLFAPKAKYDHLLFLDCDATLISADLVKNYCELLSQKDFAVVCGGSIYPKQTVARQYRLRWKNGNVRETIPAVLRNERPYGSFMTSNVIIKKSVFETVTFDESLIKYGHEDTLFGFELRKANIPVFHYSNSVLNNDLDTNMVFIEKMESALENLAFIWRKLDLDLQFSEDNRLLKMYAFLKKYRLLWTIRWSFFVLKFPLKQLFSFGFTNLYVFDYYKLAILSLALQK